MRVGKGGGGGGGAAERCVVKDFMGGDVGMRWAGHVALVGEKRNKIRRLMMSDERKKPSERPADRQNNIKRDLKCVGRF